MSFLVNRSHQENFFLNASFRYFKRLLLTPLPKCTPFGKEVSYFSDEINQKKVGGLIERELSVSVSGVGACLREVLSGVVSGLERSEPRLIRIIFAHGGSFYRGLTKKYVLPGQPKSLGEFLSQRKLPVLQTPPSHTAAQVHFVFQ
ncbi:hypothetical protein CDAR_551511 [Caerostris darwini]|uniref:Uncharacterized protein n=1 Tax=Caerostris darwini TaxID=1538125 RepID=A0AAV4V7V9_9ARAC|nr:hypothetical protein CDAR_551511 [Caerostris darwini]